MADMDFENEDKECHVPGLQFHKKFDTRRDTTDCQANNITDVVMMKTGTILAADYDNFTLKAFDMQGHFLTDLYFAQTAEDWFVRCIAVKDETSVYVTLPGMKMIALVRVDEEQGEITEENPAGKKVSLIATMLRTGRRYHGIAHLPTKQCLAVGTTNTVDLLDYNGDLMKVLHATDPPFKNPLNMATTSLGQILVSDSGSNCIFMITDNQTITVFRVSGWLQMRGVTSDERGNILFCQEKGNGVELICPQTQVKRSIMLDQPLCKPVGIHFQNTSSGNWLIFSQKDGTVRIFKYL